MRKLYLSVLAPHRSFLLLCCLFLLKDAARAQQLKITDFVLFGGNGSCPSGPGQKVPPSPGCAVLVGSGSVIQSGAVGGFNLVQTNSNVNIGGNIFSGNTVQLSTNNIVGGNITAANSTGSGGTILQAG